MKTLFAVCIVFFAGFCAAADKPLSPPSEATVVKGEVLEIADVDAYTYLRLKTKDGETWAAVSKTPVKKGAAVTIENSMVMTNFESKGMKRTFQKIVFGNLVGGGAAAPAGDMATAHSGAGKAPEVVDVKVPKASGADARTVGEIMTKSAQMKDKNVVVRGKVVKYNAGIMGKNWIHLRDGSGAAADNTNDLLVTTTAETKVGDVVVAKGVVHLDRDFGMGYAYKVLVEDATLQK